MLETALDSVVGCMVERADLDADRTAVIVTKVRETVVIVHTRDLPIGVVYGFGQDRIHRALTDGQMARIFPRSWKPALPRRNG